MNVHNPSIAYADKIIDRIDEWKLEYTKNWEFFENDIRNILKEFQEFIEVEYEPAKNNYSEGYEKGYKKGYEEAKEEFSK